MSVYIYGKNPAKEILETDKLIIKAYFMDDTKSDLFLEVKRKQIPFETLSKKEFEKRFSGNTQGIVLEVEDYKTVSLEEVMKDLDLSLNPFFIMLDGIEDPHNFGAIIRSAEAGGCSGIIIPKNRSVKITGTVAKVSSGAIEYIKIIEVVNLNQTIEKLKKKSFWIIGTDVNSEKSYQDIFVDRPLCLVIGSEGKGLSKLVKEHVDFNVKIPMIGKINSLNASVSAGILIFDILRRKTE
ncbi:MAG: 23S rRNA (guanosine(2251)-2'-O)-methyltransferase RlmB [Firmicutes bacterium]|nr:23S rRNA (guanosine(2251)-2'-O)-methyltransferase RlmB [Bacillota bacterium]